MRKDVTMNHLKKFQFHQVLKLLKKVHFLHAATFLKLILLKDLKLLREMRLTTVQRF